MTTTRMAGLLALAAVAAAAIGAGCGGGGGGGAGPRTQSVTVKVGALPGPQGAAFALALQDSSGRLVSSSAVTGSSTQQVLVPHAGMVTLAAAVGGTNFGFATYVDPPDGTTIRFHDPLPLPTATPPATFQTWNVTVTPNASATYYTILGPCGGVSNTTSVALPIVITTQACRERTSGKILVLAQDGSFNPIAWHKTDLLTAMPGGITNLTITADQTSVLNVNSQYLELSPGVTTVDTGFIDLDPSFVDYSAYRGSAYTAVSTGQTQAFLYFRFPDLGPTLVREEVGGYNGFAYRDRTLSSPPASTSFDLGGLEIPTFPIFDAPTGTFFWEMPLFGFGETFRLQMLGPGNVTVRGTVIVPPGTQSLTIPSLPAAFVSSASLLEFNAGGQAIAPDVDGVSSYRDYVEHAGDQPAYDFTGGDGTFLFAAPLG